MWFDVDVIEGVFIPLGEVIFSFSSEIDQTWHTFSDRCQRGRNEKKLKIFTVCLVTGHYFDSVFCSSRAELRASVWNNA
jgi:hypothetical protein